MESVEYMWNYEYKGQSSSCNTRIFKLTVAQWHHGVASLTFRELSKMIPRKIYNTRNDIYGENFKLKICTCAQSMALDTRTKCQLEILIGSTISAIHKFRENILEGSRNVVVTLFSNIIHEQNTSNTNLTNKAYPGYCKHVLCWRPPEKVLAYLAGGNKIM